MIFSTIFPPNHLFSHYFPKKKAVDIYEKRLTPFLAENAMEINLILSI